MKFSDTEEGKKLKDTVLKTHGLKQFYVGVESEIDTAINLAHKAGQKSVIHWCDKHNKTINFCEYCMQEKFTEGQKAKLITATCSNCKKDLGILCPDCERQKTLDALINWLDDYVVKDVLGEQPKDANIIADLIEKLSTLREAKE